MTFDMNRTWDTAMSLLSANAQLLAIIAGVFMLVPGTLLVIAAPDAVVNVLSQVDPDPQQVLAVLLANAGPLALLALVLFVSQLLGYLAMIALIGDDRPTVGEALRRALAYLPAAIGVTLLLVAFYMAVAIAGIVVLLLIAGLGMLAGGQALGALFAGLGVVVMMLVVTYLGARFMLTMPLVALDGVTGPLQVCKRSWQLTQQHSRRIFAFYLLLTIAYLVIATLVGWLFEALAAILGNGTAADLVTGLGNGLVGAAGAMVLTAIMVALHRQLTGLSATTIDQTFG